VRPFIYISRAKLANYFEQLPKSRIEKEKLTAKIGVPLASVEATQEWAALPDMQKLLLVESAIVSGTDEVGNIDYPGLWVKDEVLVAGVSLSEEPDGVLFIGERNDSFVLLVGSAHHIIGSSVQPSMNRLPMSYAYEFYRRLQDVIRAGDQQLEWLQEYLKRQHAYNPPFFAFPEGNLAHIMEYMHKYSSSARMTIRFLGVRLWHYENDKQRFTLVSPLFVELL
jgi:hypothetical protein